MPAIARLVGGAGTGKTSALLETMAKVIEAGTGDGFGMDPDRIGFVSFTRAARKEAAERAAEQFGCTHEDLRWFRTLHSICYQALGVGQELLTENRDSQKWIAEAIQEPVDTIGESEDGEVLAAFEGHSDAATALSLWGAARNRLEPFDDAWRRADQCNDATPALEWCRDIIERYETHKKIDHRCDFTDLLGRFAGWRFTLDGHDEKGPEGDVPGLPVWFLDEQQDTSKLLDSVCHRLINAPVCRFVYVVGDFFQAIYGWAGADPSLFMAWPAAKEKTMPKSWRCPKPILDLGEDILSGCSDYFDRGIAPADHEGEIDEERKLRTALAVVDPREDWLLIARSNFHAKRMANLLDVRDIPWLPTKGNNFWKAPKRTKALLGMMRLEQGAPIEAAEWKAIVDILPSKSNGTELFVRGTKATWAKSDHKAGQPIAKLGDLRQWGATEDLFNRIANGSWPELIEHGDRYVSAVREFGEDAIAKPGVQVGTVHSVKGAEAENVVVLTTTSEPVARSRETTEGDDEERRVAYVAVTRTKRRLIVVNEKGKQNTMEIEP